MAIQSFKLDPAASGVSQAEFDAHTHRYRKIIRIGVSKDHLYSPVFHCDILDDAEVVGFAGSNLDLEAVGVTVATEQTETPT